jgi:hypothetical protein
MMVKDYPWDIGGILIYKGEILEKIIGDEAMTPGSGSGWVQEVAYVLLFSPE